jgi:hypothetical protein
MPKNTEVSKGIIIQQDQQSQYPFVLPLKSINSKYLEPETKAFLQNAHAIAGTTAQVANGFADFSDLQSAINAVSALGGGKVYAYSGIYTGNITVPTDVMVEGYGHTTSVVGNLNFTGNYALVKNLRVDGDITFNASTDGNRMSDCWMGNGHSLTNLGLGGNVWDVSEE